MIANESQRKSKQQGAAENARESQEMPSKESAGTAQLRQLQQAANASAQVSQLRNLQAAASAAPQVQQAAQRQQAIGQSAAPAAGPKNETGMPDSLKNGIESLSGMDMSDVRVHYNSSKPAQLQAHAFAQGSDIHIASGQEQHLAHEAWHVVQQRQGRVQATTEVGGSPVNDDESLEKEADSMGAKAANTTAAAPAQLAKGSRPSMSAQLVAQLFQTGSKALKNKDNRKLALQELDQITANDLGQGMQRVENLNPGTLARYKDEYRSYLITQGTYFQWPYTYLNGRGARKNGRIAENGAIQRVHPNLQKNNQAYEVVFNNYNDNLETEYVTVIPDFISNEIVGDVKNVKYQAFTEQLHAMYAMSKGFDRKGDEVEVYKANTDEEVEINGARDFDLIVRSEDHPDGETEVSGPLESAADNIWYDIDN